MKNSFETLTELAVDGQSVRYHSLPALERAGFPAVGRLPYSLKILLENLLRREDGGAVTSEQIAAFARRTADAPPQEIAFSPAR
ncbi:MAG TPA: hypothetical protein DCP38_08585, partial [Acidobacteria bacterium]|nr:hypothetical protein [Acidobacteriota bacterium]